MNAAARDLDEARATFIIIFRRLAWLPPLLARVTLGVVFVVAGLRKFHDLGQVATSFEKLGIPAPSFNASLVAGCELVCGTLLLIGLLSRLATIPLMITMVVALATAKAKEIHSVAGLFGSAEFCLLVLLFIIAVNGPGLVSLDAALTRWWASRRPTRRIDRSDLYDVPITQRLPTTR